MLGEVPVGWSQIPVGDMLSESEIQGSTGLTAQKLTVKLYGKGVVAKLDRALGSANTRYFRRRAGQFIYSRLDFLNGAFAIIPEELDGRESTADLPAFDILPAANPAWLLYFVSRPDFYERYGSAAIGSRKARRISPEELCALRIPLPPLPEQQKIAAILSSVDEAIQATQGVIDQTRRVKEGLLQDLLTRGLPGHTRFKQTEIGEIPEGWEVRSVEDVCSRVGVGIASSATHAYRDTGVPLIRNQNIKYGYLDLSDLLYIDEGYDRLNQTKRIHTGDVLTIRTGYPGVSAVVPPEMNNAQSFTTLVSTPRNSLIRSQFLAAWINGPVGRRLVLAGEAGGAQHNFNAGELRRLLVPLPPLHEQDGIMSILESISSTEVKEQQALDRFAGAKAGLLQDLLTGKVRVTP